MEIAALLTSLEYSGMPYACDSPFADVRVALDDWMNLEFPSDGEITDEQRGAYSYNATPIKIRKGIEQLDAINKISDLLQQGYADCKPLHVVLKKIRRIHTAISRKL
ncbi:MULTISPECIES: DUF5623 domain-containing protein [Pseudomonas]|uniref:DUF5623 domain-containing protein n=2 Tax=Pseudomonas TaxID=286 RepID=A0A7X1GJ62_9PSED|nr:MULTISPECIES: DUF5623 domain-containing protein [Pseudomonas]MBC2692598.1 DUF5623 domain-containing protein [Pseudomonas kielensis]MDD1009334.1 DUF5623 domain-containing protein [Pseudomonas shahriarae]